MTGARRALVLMVVNDFPVVTAGVAAVLHPYRHRVEVEQFVGELPETGRVDVLLLDLFGNPDPAARIRQVVETSGAAVLVFGWVENQEQVDAAVRDGASGFLSKTLDGAAIVAAVEAAAAGTPVLSEPAPASEVMATWPGQHKGLTARESEVLSLIVSGLSNHDIADRIYLSIGSVKSHVRSAYRKIGVTSRSQAVVWGLEHGFRIEHSPSWDDERH